MSVGTWEGVVSQDCRKHQFGKDLRRSCLKNVQEEQVAPGLVQSSFEHLKGWRSHYIFGTLFVYSHNDILHFFSYTETTFPVPQEEFVSFFFCSCPPLRRAWLCVLYTPSYYVVGCLLFLRMNKLTSLNLSCHVLYPNHWPTWHPSARGLPQHVNVFSVPVPVPILGS